MAVTENGSTQSNGPNNSSGRIKICYHNRWITVCSILFSSVATFFCWVFVLQLTMKHGFLSYLGLSNQYFLKEPNSLKDPLMLHHIGELVANGTILSLDDLWSFQSSFYQTIITVLIAINAILGAFAFFMVKHSSNAMAREEAIIEVNAHMDSIKFDKSVKAVIEDKVERKINEKIASTQFDLNEQIETISEIAGDISELRTLSEKVDAIAKENSELKRYINVLAKNIALKDTVDNDGGSFVLKKEVE
ncbi:hydrolase [Yersinia massiliensis]|uniref:Hydrolase n=1 Tax=Yersinia massiliensis TaxID=419257 RepID=A0ABM6UNW1_9GAMM|nr:hydrolase [Yersinia massiliensis]AVX36653.1 hydrolase [Yersinia massiliensis]QKJ11457.1 hydrolase [Yersinia massiliensis]